MTLSRASPACGNCRSRRIKCNLLHPRCSQCARAGLECSGYRSQSELLFRDQTTSTIRKAQPKRISAANLPTRGCPFARPSSDLNGVAQKVFTDNFHVLGEGCKSWMDCRAAQPSSTTISLTSVGLAALALVHKDPQLMDLARRKYQSAIKALTAAITCRVESGVEQSIASSFILSIFEMMTCDKSSTYDAWPKHVIGAATFLGYLHSANGLPQSPVAEIVDVCFTTALACLVSNALVPEFLLQLPDQFEPGLDTLENDKRSLALAMQLFNIIGPLVNAHNLGNHNALTTSQLVLFAIHSTDALHNWVNSLPTSWKYGKGRGSSYDSYQNVWFARIWNYYRLAHILANRIILDNLNTPSFPKLPNSEVVLGEVHCDNLIYTSSCMLQGIYDALPFMLNSECASSASLPLSASLLFITSVLQSLSKITDRSTLMTTWSIPASKVLGERFTLTKNIVNQNLHWKPVGSSVGLPDWVRVRATFVDS